MNRKRLRKGEVPVRDMAIFKATYTKQAGAAKATIRYIEHRPGKEGEKITRSLWGWGGKIERSEAYKLIDEADKRSYFYRIILNFDPLKEDTHKDIYVRTVTEQTMKGLEERLGTPCSFIAATHDDHTDKRHVHIVAILPRRLNRDDLVFGHDVATDAALEQRRERDHLRELQQERGNAWERER